MALAHVARRLRMTPVARVQAGARATPPSPAASQTGRRATWSASSASSRRGSLQMQARAAGAAVTGLRYLSTSGRLHRQRVAGATSGGKSSCGSSSAIVAAPPHAPTPRMHRRIKAAISPRRSLGRSVAQLSRERLMLRAPQHQRRGCPTPLAAAASAATSPSNGSAGWGRARGGKHTQGTTAAGPYAPHRCTA